MLEQRLPGATCCREQLINIVIAGGSGGPGGAFVEALARRSGVRKIVATCNFFRIMVIAVFRNRSSCPVIKCSWKSCSLPPIHSSTTLRSVRFCPMRMMVLSTATAKRRPGWC